MPDPIPPASGRIFYGWWVVFSSAAIILLTGATFFYGFGVFFQPIIDEFGWSNTQVALASSLRSEVSAFAAPLIGLAVDRFGVRRVLIAGVLIVGLGFGALAQVQDLLSFYLAMSLIAIGTSASGGSAGIVAVSRWFVRKRSRALALMTLGAGFSGVMVPVIAMLVTRFGWRSALIVMGVFVIGVGLPLARRMRDRPEEMGLWPDGEPHPPADGTGAPPTAPMPSPAGQDHEGMALAQALRRREFWQLTVAMTLAGLASTAVVVYQVPVLQHAGVSAELAALSVTGLTLVSVTGRLGFGWMGDFWDKRWVIGACFGLQTVGILFFAALGPAWLVFPFLLTFSPGFGGPIPVRPALMAQYFGTRALGSIQGSFMLAQTLGAVIGPLVVGYMYDTTGSYQAAFFVMAVVSAAAVPVMLTAPRPQHPSLPA
ncbi:MAG: MFS transporter [Chloroflexi bacterium]|nr:MFS transporter [Chloroflexota bacterium]